MSLTQKASIALGITIILCGVFTSLLMGPSFQPVSVVIDFERQETQELLGNGWRIIYHEEWDTIETFAVQSSASMMIELPIADTYLMKYKARLAQPGQRIVVWFNHTRLGEFTARKNQVAERFYVTVPSTITHVGRNLLTIQTDAVTPPIALEKMTFTNVLWGHPTNLLLTWKTSLQPVIPSWYRLAILVGSLYIFGLWSAATIWWTNRLPQSSIGPLLLLDLYSYLPLLFCLGVLSAFPLVSPYRWVVNASWYPVQALLFLAGIPKLYLFGCVGMRLASAGQRYMEQVTRTISQHKTTFWLRGRVDYATVRTSLRLQSWSATMALMGVLIAADVRQRSLRVMRRIRWVARLHPGNRPLIIFLEFWGLAWVCLIVFHAVGLSEQIVNVAILFLAAGLLKKGYELRSEPREPS